MSKAESLLADFSTEVLETVLRVVFTDFTISELETASDAICTATKNCMSNEYLFVSADILERIKISSQKFIQAADIACKSGGCYVLLATVEVLNKMEKALDVKLDNLDKDSILEKVFAEIGKRAMGEPESLLANFSKYVLIDAIFALKMNFTIRELKMAAEVFVKAECTEEDFFIASDIIEKSELSPEMLIWASDVARKSGGCSELLTTVEVLKELEKIFCIQPNKLDKGDVAGKVYAEIKKRNARITSTKSSRLGNSNNSSKMTAINGFKSCDANTEIE